ncbi:MAG: type I methionyl aminopeptidase [Actinobacteria bacterium]|jgi:methionyl aminopeptidase|nr:type I methionyl aminopeptidase [Actinomycetota bacterium]MCL5886437.1 type I methionyl aminopeptidase [Actinomycetota bacterium]
MIRRKDELDKMRKAGRVVAEILHEIEVHVKPGVTTAFLDKVARDVLDRRGARSNFLGYRGYPATICTSPNDVIVHGIPGSYILQEGDIISVDCGAIVEGYHGDAARTFPVGEVSAESMRLMEVTREALEAGKSQLHPAKHLNEVGRAVERVGKRAGYGVVKQYVGHAIGTAMHEEPQVPNYWPGKPGIKLASGMVFAVEPMFNIGSSDTVQLDDGWTVVTKDGSMSAHFEDTIAVTEHGPEVFTA